MQSRGRVTRRMLISHPAFMSLMTILAVSCSVRAQLFSNTGEHTVVMKEDAYLDTIPDAQLRNFTQRVLDICPDTNFCGITVNIESTNLCCISKCSCQPHCHVTQSCCPHVLNEISVRNATGVDPRYTCTRAAILNRGSKKYGTEYLFVTSCPPETSESVRRACTNVVYNETFSLADVVPVSDRLTNQNFFNRHCAACNHVLTRNMMLWSPNMICFSSPFQDGNDAWSSVEERILARDDCLVTFDPPPDGDANATLCASVIITECNVTGRWARYDRAVEESCRQFPQRFVIPGNSVRLTRTYGNLFCALCNGEHFWSKFTCSNLNIDQLTKLLLYVRLPDDDDTQSSSTCKGASQILDPITGSCQDLHCTKPLILDAVNILCTDVVDHLSFARYAIPLKVDISVRPLSLFDINVIRNELYVGTKALHNDVCGMDFYVKLLREYSHPHPGFSDGGSQYISALIKEVYVTVYLNIQQQPHPGEYVQTLIARITAMTLSVSGTQLPISYGSFDAPFQSPFVQNVTHPHTLPHTFHVVMPFRLFIWERKPIGTPLIIYKDPYDNLTVLGGLETPPLNRCANGGLIRDTGFLNCTTFLYDMREHGLERDSKGLVFRGGEVFEFGEFVSLNESHVRICSDVVLDRVSFRLLSAGCRLSVFTPLFLVVCVWKLAFE